MQYTEGTVAVTNGSQTVVGTSTHWVSNVDASYVFKIVADHRFYDVLSVTDDTHLTLSIPYQGSTDSGLSYVIIRDYTANFSFPTITKGDINWPEIISKSLQMIDANLYETQSGKYVKSITFEPLTSSPIAEEGVMYYEASLDTLVFWNGSAWKKIVTHTV